MRNGSCIQQLVRPNRSKKCMLARRTSHQCRSARPRGGPVRLPECHALQGLGVRRQTKARIRPTARFPFRSLQLDMVMRVYGQALWQAPIFGQNLMVSLRSYRADFESMLRGSADLCYKQPESNRRSQRCSGISTSLSPSWFCVRLRRFVFRRWRDVQPTVRTKAWSMNHSGALACIRIAW